MKLMLNDQKAQKRNKKDALSLSLIKTELSNEWLKMNTVLSSLAPSHGLCPSMQRAGPG